MSGEEDFSYSVVADGSQALDTSNKLEQSLERVEEQAGRTGTAMTGGLRDAQGRFVATAVAAEEMGDAYGLVELAAKRSAVSMDEFRRLTELVTKTPLAPTLQADVEMLNRINGPVDRYNQGLESLDRLLRQDQITVQQYTAELNNLSVAYEKAVQGAQLYGPVHDPSKTVLAPQYGPVFNPAKAGGPDLGAQYGPVFNPAKAGGPDLGAQFGPVFDPAKAGQGGGGGGITPGGIASSLAQQSGGLGSSLSGLASSEAVQTAGIVGLGLEVVHLSNEYEQLQNRMRFVAGANGDLSQTTADVAAAAARARVGVEGFAETLVKLKGATDSLGFSQKDQIDLTETIAKGLKVSGSGAAESTRVMSELTHAFAGSEVQGRSFLALMRNAPVLITALAEAAGMTRAKFVELGHSGHLTSTMLAEDFMKAKPIIEKMFERTEAPLSDQLTVLKDRVMLTVGELVHATGIVPLLNAALGGLGTAIRTVGAVLSPIVGLLGDLVHALSSVPGGLNAMGLAIGALMGGPLGAFIIAVSAINAVVDALGALKDAFFGPGEEAKRMAEEIQTAHRAVAGSYHALETAAEKAAKAQDAYSSAVGKHEKEKAYDQLAVARMAQTNAEIDALQRYRHEQTLLAAQAQDEGDKEKERTAIMNLRATAVEYSAAQHRKLGQVLEAIAHTSKGVTDGLDTGKHVIESWTDNINKLRDSVDSLNKALHATDANKAINPNSAMGIALQRQKEDAELKLDMSTKSYGKAVETAVMAARSRKREEQDLTEALHDGSIKGEERAAVELKLAEMRKKDAGVMKGLLSEVEKMELRLLKPFKDYQLELQAIAILQAKMPQHADLWAEELEKIHAKNPGLLLLEATIKRHIEAYDRAAAAAREWKRAMGEDTDKPGFMANSDFDNADPRNTRDRNLADALRNAQAFQKGYDIGQPKIDKEGEERERSRLSYLNDLATATDKYGERQLQLSHDLETGVVDQEMYVKLYAKMIEQFNDMKTPFEVFAMGVRDADEKLKAGIYTLDAYERKLRQLREAAGTGTMADGFHDFADQLKKDASNSALSLSLMKGAFDDVTSALTTLVTKGTGDFGEFVSKLVDDLATLIIKAEMAKLVMAALGLGGGGAAGLLSAGVSGIGLGATAGGGHADGGFIARGSGGTDSAIYMVGLTPGERVDFTPPGRMAASSQHSAPAPIIRMGDTHTHIGFDRREFYKGMYQEREGRNAIMRTVNLNSRTVKSSTRRPGSARR